MEPRTLPIRSAKGRAASAAICARRSFEAATICMALVIFCVALVAAMRTRMSLREAISCQSPWNTTLAFVVPGLGSGIHVFVFALRERLREALDHALELGVGLVGEVAAVADAVEQVGMLRAQRGQKSLLERLH